MGCELGWLCQLIELFHQGHYLATEVALQIEHGRSILE